MTFFHKFLLWFIGTIVVTIVGLCIQSYRVKKAWYLKMSDLKDCPFKYERQFDDRHEYVVFDLGEGAALWCDYNFGIRPDGIYGIKDIKLQGINGDSGNKLRLKIGQSIFPIMLRMEEFEAWAARKSFNTAWDWTFTDLWTEMKKTLDNLKYLEHKSNQQE